MKFAIIVVATAVLFANSMALAQNASTGSTITTGDAAVSPATSSPANAGSSSGNYPSPGAGIASGAMNNGTTGDTIGTGHGTAAGPTTGTGTSDGTAHMRVNRRGSPIQHQEETGCEVVDRGAARGDRARTKTLTSA
jgi:hypothetical protein